MRPFPQRADRDEELREHSDPHELTLLEEELLLDEELDLEDVGLLLDEEELDLEDNELRDDEDDRQLELDDEDELEEKLLDDTLRQNH